jgi:hypothetical protein
MKKTYVALILILSANAYSGARPTKHIELLPYVLQAPNQGETATCWFQASTGAMELLANKKAGIKNPKPGSKYDLAESFLIWQNEFLDNENYPESIWETHVLKFNYGYGIHISQWPFKATNSDGTTNTEVWSKHPNFDNLPRVSLPKVATEKLFVKGAKWATRVLEDEDIELIKQSIVKYNSPVLVNYVDDGFWHVILIVGFNDKMKSSCYGVDKSECSTKRGAFYVRDSFGERIESRSTDWFKIMGNAASVVRLAE